jgi:hypothetical protein
METMLLQEVVLEGIEIHIQRNNLGVEEVVKQVYHLYQEEFIQLQLVLVEQEVLLLMIMEMMVQIPLYQEQV